VVLCAAFLVTLGYRPALCAPVATNDDPSPVSLPSAQLAPETMAIRKTLESYVHAVENKDVELFRSIKPTMSEEEERRARAAFRRSHASLSIRITSCPGARVSQTSTPGCSSRGAAKMFSTRSFSDSISGSLKGTSGGWTPSCAMNTSAGASDLPSRDPSSQTG